MDGFARRRAKKEQQIIAAAKKLFMAYGVQKVAITEIAQEARVSQVTIYNYFKNKHRLVYEVILAMMEESAQMFVDIVYSDQAFPEKMKQMMAYKIEISQKINEEFYHYMMKEYVKPGGQLETFMQEKIMKHWHVLLAEGRAYGYIDPTISDEAILFYFEMMRDCVRQQEVYQKILPLTEDITKLFFYGLIGKSRDEGNTTS
ncbi:TetR/AcrR family transcriptional regulator [Shouchella lonarensis]|uniref:Transcriptional regulator, TetR family n=1 Tax=Shouchella lonarensis TaxID=1464122 RepID=A0A1G6HFH8_9BACI|nr:TetR/AcrR family transcriptional regulator [Shouchella lonarensis]SDB92914.1 transcriptional regulator, TetR family [Shouchella lonarensis]